VVALLGSKPTLGELTFLREQGWHHDILAHARGGGRITGICGGYQVLGQRISDLGGVDGPAGEAPGLGLLQVETVMGGDKSVRPVQGHCAVSGQPVSGYEIHMGRTTSPDTARPMLHLSQHSDGARSPDGRITGCYVHGLFASYAFRREWLARAGAASSELDYEAAMERALDELADAGEQALDVDALLGDAR
jgi:adenosylcobyric acid synthase